MSQTTQLDVELYQHVRVLISIMIGLSVAHLVGGVASLIQHPTRYRVSFIHLGWVAWALINVLAFWWWEFRLRLVEHWNLGLYFFICFFASMYYFLSVLLFPGDIEGYGGYQDYFLSRRIWLFGFAALIEALDMVDTWIKGPQYFWSFGIQPFVYTGAFVVLCAIAARTRNLAFHTSFVIGILLYDVIYFVIVDYDIS